MIIEKIDIKSFGALSNLAMEFSDSINVIEGENESGKSTIASFIKYMLFGFDTDGGDKDGRLGERKRSISWTSGKAEGSMVVRVGEKRYLVTRSCEPVTDEAGRVSYKEDSSIIDLENGANTFGKMGAGYVFLGGDGELYRNTAFVGQISDTAINSGSVSESIENILFSVKETLNTQAAKEKIADKMESLTHKGGHGGLIPDLMRKQEELSASLARINEDTKQILNKESELYSLRCAKDESCKKLNNYYECDTSYKNWMVIQTFDRLHELEERCREKTEAYNAFVEENVQNGYVPTESYLTDLMAGRRRVNEAYVLQREAEDRYTKEKNAVGITAETENAIQTVDDLGGEESVIASAKGFVRGIIKRIVLGTMCGLALIAGLIIALVAPADMKLLLGIIGGALVAGGAVGGGICTLGILRNKRAFRDIVSRFGVGDMKNLTGKLAHISESRAKRDAMIKATSDARFALDAARAEYEDAKLALTRLIVRWGEEPPTSELNRFLDSLENKVTAFLERNRNMLEEKNTLELTVKEIRQSLSSTNEIDVRAQVNPLRRKSLETLNHDTIITGIADEKVKIAELERAAFTVENELITYKSRGGDPADTYSRIADIERRVDALKDRHKAYFVAKMAIEQASDSLRAGISPRLGEYATSLMEIMTDRKYGGFDVSSGMKVTFTDSDGISRDVDYLSGGTRDLAYVAVRFALIDMLYRECPPICLDETFAHQDNVRASAMMKALAFMSEQGYQSFVFTCRAREGVLARELIPECGVFALSVTGTDE